VHGKGLYGLKQPSQPLDAGNSGTTMRLLTGILSAQNFTTTITGDHSLQKRPMDRIITPLSQMGIKIDSINGKAPLIIHGQKLKPIDYHSPIASAQVKSSILLAGLYADGETTVREPTLSRDHTERMLPCFGINVKNNNLEIKVVSSGILNSTSIDTPGDISSAAFLMVAASLVQGSSLTLHNIGTNPTRTGIIYLLKKMGTKITKLNSCVINNEPRADFLIETSSLKNVQIDKEFIPKLIDEIPILAIGATQAQGETIVRNAKELRVKETDRINAITSNLKKMGIQIQEFDDGFSIKGPQPLHGAVIESYGDHRIAMAFTIAGLIAKGETTICDSECVNISYPDFYQDLEKVIDAE